MTWARTGKRALLDLSCRFYFLTSLEETEAAKTMPRARPRPRQALHGAVGPHRLAVTGASYGLAATTTAGSVAGSSSGAGQSTSSEPETLTLSVPPVAITSESALLQAVADSQCQIHELLTLLQVRYVAARAPCSKARQRIIFVSPLPSLNDPLSHLHALRRRSARRASRLSGASSTSRGASSASRRRRTP